MYIDKGLKICCLKAKFGPLPGFVLGVYWNTAMLVHLGRLRHCDGRGERRRQTSVPRIFTLSLHGKSLLALA